MGSPDPSAGRLALAPSEPPPRSRTHRDARRRPEPPEPPGRRPSAGRGRLVGVTILLTIAALAYFLLTSLGGGGGGDAGATSGDAYLRANRAVATDAQAVVQAGADLRALRDVDGFRATAERSLAGIATQVSTLQRLSASHRGAARTTIDETVASAQRLALFGAAFERDVGKLQLGAANRDELSIHDEIVNLAQQATAWKRR